MKGEGLNRVGQRGESKSMIRTWLTLSRDVRYALLMANEAGTRRDVAIIYRRVSFFFIT